jgi:hypothetical protein
MSGKIGGQAAREALAQRILIGCGLFGALIGAGHATFGQLDIVVPRALVFAISLVGGAAASALSIIYWRNIDEAAREAHKFAWFWGASGGILVMLPLGALIGSERLIAVMGQRSPGEWVFFGSSALLAAQIIGYGLVWAGWWLRQR